LQTQFFFFFFFDGKFIANNSANFGGGIYVAAAGLEIRSSLIIFNNASQGGGFNVNTPQMVFIINSISTKINRRIQREDVV
jgi:predicted outer membrane repeat protein